MGVHATHGTEQSIEFEVTAARQVGASDGGGAIARAQFAMNVFNHRKGGGKKNFDFVDARTLSCRLKRFASTVEADGGRH